MSEAVDLPDEVWAAVFELLEPIHATTITLTCHRWRDVFRSGTRVWRAYHERLLGGPRVPAILVLSPNCTLELTRSRPVHPKRYKKIKCEASRTDGSGVFYDPNGWRAAMEYKLRRV